MSHGHHAAVLHGPWDAALGIAFPYTIYGRTPSDN